MPRPLKMVPPDTLGGRIRSARQKLHYSLADVAGKKYSTSLISQIERNRIEPSEDSLRYLAEQLQLPLDELLSLAQQHRQSEAEADRYKKYEDLRVQVSQLFATRRPRRALELLKDATVSQIPVSLRWRIIALRGECYFSLRQFLAAQRDFLTAVAILPEHIASDQSLELVTLRLHLAAASRELGQMEAAYEQYYDALNVMDTSTPLRYVAEAHWGLSLVLFEQAKDLANHDRNGAGPSEKFTSTMQLAFKHAGNARTLYSSTNESLRSALLDCQIALVEQELNNLSEARQRLQNVLDDWAPTLNQGEVPTDPALAEKMKRYSLKERANVVSAAACYLAGIEHAENQCDQALKHIEQALEAGRLSYILRRAEAYMMQGQILAAMRPEDPQVVEAFENALHELESTDRLGAKILVHDMLGRYLLKRGKTKEGEMELETARRLSHLPSMFRATSADEEAPPNG